jgi:rhodanese-related sulfurtransferase
VTQSNDIGARTLKDMLERGERVTLVDARRQEQHAEGSIPGSVNFDAIVRCMQLSLPDDLALTGHTDVLYAYLSRETL